LTGRRARGGFTRGFSRITLMVVWLVYKLQSMRVAAVPFSAQCKAATTPRLDVTSGRPIRNEVYNHRYAVHRGREVECGWIHWISLQRDASSTTWTISWAWHGRGPRRSPPSLLLSRSIDHRRIKSRSSTHRDPIMDVSSVSSSVRDTTHQAVEEHVDVSQLCFGSLWHCRRVPRCLDGMQDLVPQRTGSLQ
jgi:hypothetical protein